MQVQQLLAVSLQQLPAQHQQLLQALAAASAPSGLLAVASHPQASPVSFPERSSAMLGPPCCSSAALLARPSALGFSRAIRYLIDCSVSCGVKHMYRSFAHCVCDDICCRSCANARAIAIRQGKVETTETCSRLCSSPAHSTLQSVCKLQRLLLLLSSSTLRSALRTATHTNVYGDKAANPCSTYLAGAPTSMGVTTCRNTAVLEVTIASTRLVVAVASTF